MSKPLYEPVVGRIAFGVNIDADGQPIARTVRVIKTANINETPEAKRRRLDMALLRMLIEVYPDKARELVLKS